MNNKKQIENMTQTERLQEAMALMKDAERIVESLMSNDEDSLNEYYGYSLHIIQQQLNKFSDDSLGYGGNASIKEMIESEGYNWKKT